MRGALRRRPGLLWAAAAITAVLAAVALALVATDDHAGAPAASRGAPLAARSTRLTPASWLHTYVDHGRVVRRDQGGDTVSEGQAYGMLIALGARDQRSFDAIWRWSDEHLSRDDGLLSWRWENGTVVDPSSAADADLDMARALVQAGTAFHEDTYTRAGVALGRAILDHETIATPSGLVLVAGQWATEAPHWFNPSYVSPVATAALRRASGDPRWTRLDRGSTAAVRALTRDGRLPPDWAQVDDQGRVAPSDAPDGGPVQYGYDAARTPLRYAESCSRADRGLAVQMSEVVAHDGAAPVARYDLAGSPQTSDTSPLVTVSQAAGLAAAGHRQLAVRAIRAAGEEQQHTPTYYGDAWTVLGPLLLTDRALGGCPVLEHS